MKARKSRAADKRFDVTFTITEAGFAFDAVFTSRYLDKSASGLHIDLSAAEAAEIGALLTGLANQARKENR